MAVDTKELKEFRDRLQSLNNVAGTSQFLDDCTNELAARFLQKVIKKTPKGQYPSGSGRTGGTLRRGWTSNVQTQNHVYGGYHVRTITNPVEYASYVEYGHRKRGGKGWVAGQFFMKRSEDEINRSANAILQSKLDKWLKGVVK